MHRLRWVVALVALILAGVPAVAGVFSRGTSLDRLNARIQGHVVDYTNNHGQDRRIWSDALCEKRDLYIYLPPCYDPHRCYPLMVWLHGFAQDEQSFTEHLAEPIDAAIVAGKLPPMIVVAPDGSLDGQCSYTRTASFFLNSAAGRFEDFLMGEVWSFVHNNYPICPEREAHVLAGVSMGGGAAYNLAFKYRDRCKSVLGLFPPLNTRWNDCHDRYRGNFSPDCWHWKTSWDNRHEVVARFYGVFTLRTGQVIRPLYGRKGQTSNEELTRAISSENPAEMLFTYDVQPGELEMFIAYGGKDEFNMDAQIESFLYLARGKGICPTVHYAPRGRHDTRTAFLFLDDILNWLNTQLKAYYPPRPCR
jgi:enterochelin esterase-like enzyme